MKKICLSVLLFIFAVNIFAMGGQEDTSSKSGSSLVKIENFNHTTEYSKVPERIISLSAGEAEMLAALGLEDKIIAVGLGHNTINDIMPEYRDKIKNKPMLKEVSLEYLLSLAPDFIVTTSYPFNLPAMGNYEDYVNNNVKLYVTEGTYVKNCTLQNTYNDIMNIGKIFKIEKRASALIEKMKQREKAVTEKLKNVKPVRCFVFDSNANDKYFSAGGTGLYNSLLKLAGGKNIFDDLDKQWGSVVIEEIIARNPDVILIDAYEISESGTHTKDDGQVKMDFLKSKKELSGISAIKNNKFIIVPLIQLFPGLQNLNALETIAKGLHPELFK